MRYASNSDLIDPSVGQGCRAFLSLGHDEYWDARQFESVRALRDRPAAEGGGMSLCFLSGNSVCYRTRHSQRIAGRSADVGATVTSLTLVPKIRFNSLGRSHWLRTLVHVSN